MKSQREGVGLLLFRAEMGGSQADGCASGVGSVIFPKRSCVLQGCSEFAVFVQNIPC